MSEQDENPKPKGLIQRFTGGILRRPERQVREPDNVTRAKALLNKTKLTEVASYWSGLPANREYYDEHELKKIYDMVSSQAGEPAAHSFANMVLDMPSLAPSNLVRATLSLAQNNWIYDPYFSERILEGKTDIRPVKPEEAENVHDAVAEGFFGNIAAATEGKADESISIKEAFRTTLGKDIEKVMTARDIIDGTK